MKHRDGRIFFFSPNLWDASGTDTDPIREFAYRIGQQARSEIGNLMSPLCLGMDISTKRDRKGAQESESELKTDLRIFGNETGLGEERDLPR